MKKIIFSVALFFLAVNIWQVSAQESSEGNLEKWWKEIVIYQIYPRSFKDTNKDGIGDLQGIIQKLDYLQNLGVNAVWLNPIYSSPNYDNGYDVSDYRSIMSDFGSMEDFDEMLKGMHDRNIKLIMDIVVNHSSSEHEWFQKSKKFARQSLPGLLPLVASRKGKAK